MSSIAPQNSAAPLAPATDATRTMPPVRPSLRLAASLLVVRDGPGGMEVLLVRRPERHDDRSSGAFVFPGGTLDAQDAAMHGICSGLDDNAASARLGVAANGLDFYICAVRECFEEAGLLFARDASGVADGADDDGLVRLDTLAPEALAQWREAVRHGGPGVAHVCESLGLKLAVDRLAYYSYWLTPPGLPKRFDTRFFVAMAPQGQTALHDGTEAVEHRWLRPAYALDAASGITLVNATRRILAWLTGFASAQACFDHAAGQRDIRLVMPRLARGPQGTRPVMPDEPAYAEIGRIDPDGQLLSGRYALEPGLPVRLSERVWRVTANNGNVMTGPGTNTYFVGGGPENVWAVIDPGPDDDVHVEAVLAAAPGRIAMILATHTHLDHSPAAARLRAVTGAPVLGRTTPATDRQDIGFAPDRELAHGERIVVAPGATLRVVHTPGHASNHLCYLLEEEQTLFTGDHVMQGSTVVINPPDGNMAQYLASLSMLLDEPLEWLAPGHGFLMARPHDAVRLLMRHRRQREAKVLNALQALGPTALDALLARVYDDVPERMHKVALRSLVAHLEKLREEGRAVEVGGVWRLGAGPADDA